MKITTSELKNLILEEVRILKEGNSQSAIKKFVYFSYNYNPGFIKEVWSDDHNLVQHLRFFPKKALDFSRGMNWE